MYLEDFFCECFAGRIFGNRENCGIKRFYELANLTDFIELLECAEANCADLSKIYKMYEIMWVVYHISNIAI